MYQAELSVVKLGESSFDVRVRFYDATNEAKPELRPTPEAATVRLPADRVLCAETRVSHVFADAERFRKMPIPSALRPRLEAHLAGE